MQPKRHPWGRKSGTILKLINDINIPNVNNSSMFRGIMKKVLLVQADGSKFEPDMKGQIKTERKSIIDVDSKEAQIIADEL